MTEDLSFDDTLDLLIAERKEYKKDIEWAKDKIDYFKSSIKEDDVIIAEIEKKIEDIMRADGVKSTRQAVLRTIPPCPVILEESKIPEEFIKIKRSIDKAGINKAIKAGRTVEGVGMSNGGETLVIKE